MTKFTVERPKILKKLYKINTAITNVEKHNHGQVCPYDEDLKTAAQKSPKKMEKAVKSRLRGMLKASATVYLEENKK